MQNKYIITGFDVGRGVVTFCGWSLNEFRTAGMVSAQTSTPETRGLDSFNSESHEGDSANDEPITLRIIP